MSFKCHNCYVSKSYRTLLSYVDPKMYSEYLLERYKKNLTNTELKFDFKPTFEDRTILDDLKSIKQLDDEHPIKQYVIDQKDTQ